MKHIFKINLSFIIIIGIFLFLSNLVYPETASKENTNDKQNQIPAFSVDEPKDHLYFFKEAKKFAERDPDYAIMLYKRGLFLKPDAWSERKQLAAIYERKKQYDLAILEYENINNALGSYESFYDLIMALKNSGYLRNAAMVAKKAYERYPEEHTLLFIAGESLDKAGEEKEAMGLLERYMKLRPDDKKAVFLLGSIYEKNGKFKEALQLYVLAQNKLKNDSTLNDAINRIKSKTIVKDDVMLVVPDGWVSADDGLISMDGTQNIIIFVKPLDDITKIALDTIKNEFSVIDEIIKSSTKDKEEKDVAIEPVPYIKIQDVAHIKGAKLVLATLCKNCPGALSIVSLAIPTKEKTYIFTWKSQNKIEDGEKILLTIISKIIWLN
ncbi:MAG TPA: tetratricopeptide repeat protein [Syntrophorhabdaceae bacterium]|nr:tetratricopeptide repeat protein [Syntrophorhabdaceae bacterium]